MRDLVWATALCALSGCFTDHHADDETEDGSTSTGSAATLPTLEPTASSDTTHSSTASTTGSSSGEVDVTTGDESSTGSGSPWAERRQLRIDAVLLGAVHEDFPLPILLTPDRIDYDLCQSGGEDLRFSLPDLTPLAYEIEAWNAGADSVAWVRIPRIDADNKIVLMDYGNPDAADAQDPAAVWEDRYAAVWHMTPDDSEAPANFTDATGRGHAATLNGATERNIGDGLVGPGVALDGSGVLQILSSADLQDREHLTVEAWVRPTGIGASNGSAIYGGSYELFAQLLPSGRARWHLFRELDDTEIDAIADAPLDAWTFLAGTFSDRFNRARLYYNDEVPLQGPTDDIGPITASTFDLTIGDGFIGVIDEVRIADAEHETAYLHGQYLALTDQLVSFGDPYAP